jgi:hypothetical protein
VISALPPKADIHRRLTPSRRRQGVRATRVHHQQHFTAEPLPEDLGGFHVFETPTGEFLLVNMLALAIALLDSTIAVPSIDGIERRTKTTFGHSNLHNEREVAFVAASSRFALFTGHGLSHLYRLLYLMQQFQVPRQICNDASSKDYEGYGHAEPIQPSAYPSVSKFAHGDEEPGSFERNAAFTVS